MFTEGAPKPINCLKSDETPKAAAVRPSIGIHPPRRDYQVEAWVRVGILITITRVRQRPRTQIPKAIYDRCLRARDISYSRFERDPQLRGGNFAVFYTMGAR